MWQVLFLFGNNGVIFQILISRLLCLVQKESLDDEGALQATHRVFDGVSQ